MAFNLTVFGFRDALRQIEQMELEQQSAATQQRGELKRRLDGYKAQLSKARRDLVRGARFRNKISANAAIEDCDGSWLKALLVA